MEPTPVQISKNIRHVRIRMCIALIVLLLNCYFLLAFYIGHIQRTYMLLSLYFNISSFVLLIMNQFVRFNFSLFTIRTIGILIFISTSISSIYYMFEAINVIIF